MFLSLSFYFNSNGFASYLPIFIVKYFFNDCSIEAFAHLKKTEVLRMPTYYLNIFLILIKNFYRNNWGCSLQPNVSFLLKCYLFTIMIYEKLSARLIKRFSQNIFLQPRRSTYNYVAALPKKSTPDINISMGCIRAYTVQ